MGDGIIMPAAFHLWNGSLTVILILAWLTHAGTSKKGLWGLAVLFILEIMWGINAGMLVLPFALTAFLFFIASKFLIIGYAGFMKTGLIIKLFSLSLINLGLFYAFNFFSLWTEKLFYAPAGDGFLLLPFFSWTGAAYVFILTVCYLLIFDFSDV